MAETATSQDSGIFHFRGKVLCHPCGSFLDGLMSSPDPELNGIADDVRPVWSSEREPDDPADCTFCARPLSEMV